MTQVDRRFFLKSSLVLVATGAVTGCSSDRAPAATPTSTPVPVSTRPAAAASFGPNGTHFPADLPWPGDVAKTELVADCDWTDILRKIQGLTAAKVAAGAVIRVRPGTLVGGGSGSSSRPVLANVGNQEWTRNVLICPLEGFGSVTVASEGARFDQCARLSFFGFLSAGSFVMTRCIGMQMGWSRWDALSITRGARDVALYELVVGFRRNADDTAGVRPTDRFEMTGISRYGCVFGPSVKPAGSAAHCDTVQLEGTGTGPFGPFTSVDCVDYGSSNAVMLLHDRVTLAEYRHCMLLGDTLPWRVYPLASGDYRGTPNAFSGGCRDVRLYDSVVAGAIGRLGFTHVERTSLSYQPVASQRPSASGSWTVDTSITGWTKADIMAKQAIPDYETATLRRVWAW